MNCPVECNKIYQNRGCKAFRINNIRLEARSAIFTGSCWLGYLFKIVKLSALESTLYGTK